MPDATSESLASVIKETVDPACEAVMTDDFAAYPKAMMKAGIHGHKHYTINHSAGRYVDGMVYTNGIESHFGLHLREELQLLARGNAAALSALTQLLETKDYGIADKKHESRRCSAYDVFITGRELLQSASDDLIEHDGRSRSCSQDV